MHQLLIAAALGTAVITAVRSTWSPCGRSMLSTITPVGERGRGAGYGASVTWFVTGAVLGGACLGGALAGLAALVAWVAGAGAATGPMGAGGTGVPVTVAAAVAAVAAAVAAASDMRLGGFRLPFHRRQVNELWLDRFRPWVYGAGFGWQIGVGFATYVMTAGLYLMVVLSVLGASPLLALGVGLSFGLVRGLAVLLGRGITDPERLRRFHRRFDAAEPAVRAAVVWWELALAAVALATLWAPAVLVATCTVALAAGTVLAVALVRGPWLRGASSPGWRSGG